MVDFNRGGTPLVEIVTEPDLRSAADAREFLQLLRTTLKQIGVSDVNMEEGSLRCDANVSVREAGEEELRTKTELKNMNSFRFVERGIEAEIERQIADLGVRRDGRRRRRSTSIPTTRLADRPALEGGGARLPLLPRAGPGAAGADRRRCSSARARRFPSCRPPGSSATSPSTACRADVAGDAGPVGGARAASSRRRWRPARQRRGRSGGARALDDRRGGRAPARAGPRGPA